MARSPGGRSRSTARPLFRYDPRAATLAFVESGLDFVLSGRGAQLPALAARIRELGARCSAPPDAGSPRLSILQAQVFAWIVEHGESHPKALGDLLEVMHAAGWADEIAGGQVPTN